jgi:CRISPR/Cas system-associated protein Cas10 (large subunit of type III CRISPR-Cas system)
MDIPQALKRILAKVDDDVREEHDKKNMSLQALHEEIERIIQYIETAREGVVPTDTRRIFESDEATSEASGSSPADESQAPRRRLTARDRYARFEDLVNRMVHDDQIVIDALMTHSAVPFASIIHANIDLHSLNARQVIASLGLKLRDWQVENQGASAQE